MFSAAPNKSFVGIGSCSSSSIGLPSSSSFCSLTGSANLGLPAASPKSSRTRAPRATCNSGNVVENAVPSGATCVSVIPRRLAVSRRASASSSSSSSSSSASGSSAPSSSPSIRAGRRSVFEITTAPALITSEILSPLLPVSAREPPSYRMGNGVYRWPSATSFTIRLATWGTNGRAGREARLSSAAEQFASDSSDVVQCEAAMAPSSSSSSSSSPSSLGGTPYVPVIMDPFGKTKEPLPFGLFFAKSPQ
mmetsp:Transcript_19684/g.28965  ORF Transcript_19684/g.28965 Transcript_19684/m.28965 type:complete len:250 (+) Transcript_19684:330-1079(+)